MDVYLKQAIMHVIDRGFGDPVFSQVNLDLTNINIREYLEKKIEKLVSAQSKTGMLVADSKMAQLVKGAADNFEEVSKEISEQWFNIYKQSEDAPSADVFVVLYEDDAQPYVAMLKVDYHQGFTHLIGDQDGKLSNELIIHQSILSGKTTKADEGFSVNVDELTYQLMEKKYSFSGDKMEYLSTKVIESAPIPSLEQNVKTVKKVAEKVAKQYDVPKFEVVNQVKEAVQESIEQEQAIDTGVISKHIFKDNISAQTEFNDSIAEEVEVPKMPVSKAVQEIATKKYGKQKLKLSNGIELTVPLDVYQNPDLIEFQNHPDGTISVMIKNVEKVISKL